MHKLFIILFASILFFSSCEETFSDVYGDRPANLTVTRDSVLFKVDGDIKTIGIAGPANDWSVNDENCDKTWCELQIAKKQNSGDFISIITQANPDTEVRSTYFDVIMGKESKRVYVVQIGSQYAILTDKDEVVVGNKNMLIHLAIVSNMKFSYEFDFKGATPWITIQNDYVSDEVPMKFNIAENTTGANREADLIFTQKGGTYTKTIKFTQKSGGAEYVPEDMSKLQGNKKLVVTSATGSEAVSGRELEKSYDNNVRTYYNSKVLPLKPTVTPVELIYNFTDEAALDFIIYTAPSGDVNIKGFKTTDIYVKCKGDVDFVLDQTFNFSYLATPQTVILKKEYVNPEAVKFVVKSVNDSQEKDWLVATCAEMEFWTISTKFTDIFTDNTYSKLKEGVTIAQIFAMDDPFYLNIAQNLFYGTYPAQRIAKYSPFYHMPQRNMNELSSLHGITGISVEKGKEIIIFADNIGATPVLISIFDPSKTYFDPAYDFLIYDGTNKIKAPVTGLLYVKYITPYTTLPAITVHIAGGDNNGYYDLSKHSDAQGMELVGKTTSRYFEMLGKRSHITLLSEYVKVGVPSMSELVGKYDEIVEAQEEFIGLTGGITQRVSVMFGALKDYAYKNIVMLSEASNEKFTKIENLKGDTLNELINEISCVYQHGPFTNYPEFKKGSLSLYNQYVQRKLGVTTVFESKNLYDEWFSSMFLEGKYTFDAVKDDAKKAIPFWQLHLYMSEVLERANFYQKIHATFRSRNTGATEAAIIGVLSAEAKIDLTSFFREHGFKTLGTAHPTKAPKMLHLLTEINLDIFKKNPLEAAKTGTYSITKETGASFATVTVSGTQNCVAYEVRSKKNTYKITVNDIFKIENYYDNMIIYGIGADGDEVLLTKK